MTLKRYEKFYEDMFLYAVAVLVLSALIYGFALLFVHVRNL